MMRIDTVVTPYGEIRIAVPGRETRASRKRRLEAEKQRVEYEEKRRAVDACKHQFDLVPILKRMLPNGAIWGIEAAPNEIWAWLDDHAPGQWASFVDLIGIDDDDAALAFKMRWC